MRTIPLTKGRVALIDDCDYERLCKFKWLYRSPGYASRTVRVNGRTIAVSMHRMIIDALNGLDVDHINGDRLDNRKSNLRLATTTQNTWNQRIRLDNKCGLKGVQFHSQTGKWRARITVFGKSKSLGLHGSPEDAHRAYIEAAKLYFGSFSNAG